VAGEHPETRYVERSDGVSIAYQVVGSGPIDLVYVPGFISHLDLAWSEPHFAGFLERLASFSRLVLFDKPGTGLSDPIARTRLSAGQTIHVPRGVIHSGSNIGQQPGRRVVIFSPAGMERFFLETGTSTPDAEVDLAAAIASATRHGWEFIAPHSQPD